MLRNEVHIGTLVWDKSDTSSPPVRRENNHAPMVSKAQFDKVQLLIDQRSPAQCKPRTRTSDYLLSGLIFCEECGYAMQGCSAKSGQFQYYACHNSIRKGKTVCNSKMVNKDHVERAVIEKLKNHVLTEDNLTELLVLTNQELERSSLSSADEIAVIEKEISKRQRKLDNLYTVLDTGKLEIDDIAPRIRELRTAVDELRLRREALEQSVNRPIKPMTKNQLRAYVKDLRNLLGEGLLSERKGFIRSFVKRITVKGDQIIITYTYPLPEDPDGGGTEVLFSARKSSPGRTILGLLGRWLSICGRQFDARLTSPDDCIA